MTVPWKPAGYSSVSPYLIATDAQRVIEFLQAAFGAIQLRRYDKPDGTIIHAEVKIDDTVVMIGEAAKEWPALNAHIHVYVRDADETYRKAIAAGGTSAQEPKQQDGDPDRRGGVRDPSGNTWWMSSQVSR